MFSVKQSSSTGRVCEEEGPSKAKPLNDDLTSDVCFVELIGNLFGPFD